MGRVPEFKSRLWDLGHSGEIDCHTDSNMREISFCTVERELGRQFRTCFMGLRLQRQQNMTVQK